MAMILLLIHDHLNFFLTLIFSVQYYLSRIQLTSFYGVLHCITPIKSFKMKPNQHLDHLMTCS